MSKELKKPSTYDEQVKILQEKGCIIDNADYCKSVLESINYYRFTAYFLPFKRDNGTYIDGTTFRKVYRIYEFDRKLRGILFSAIEEIEIFLRSSFSYHFAHKYGAEGYLDKNNFTPKHNHEKFIANINREIESNSKVAFIKHHQDNYGGRFPLWVLTEVFTFGMLSYFYNDMKTEDKKVLASELFNTTYKNVGSWLRCCTDLRNICAHYGRLYYWIFSAIPAMPQDISMPDSAKRRLWGAMIVLKSLYPNAMKWDIEILPHLEALFEAYKYDISLYHIAFPDNWKKQLKKLLS